MIGEVTGGPRASLQQYWSVQLRYGYTGQHSTWIGYAGQHSTSLWLCMATQYFIIAKQGNTVLG